MERNCGSCKFFDNDPARIEAAVPGLNALSSAYASVRADAGLCSRHDVFLAPWKRCAEFEAAPKQGAFD